MLLPLTPPIGQFARRGRCDQSKQQQLPSQEARVSWVLLESYSVPALRRGWADSFFSFSFFFFLLFLFFCLSPANPSLVFANPGGGTSFIRWASEIRVPYRLALSQYYVQIKTSGGGAPGF